MTDHIMALSEIRPRRKLTPASICSLSFIYVIGRNYFNSLLWVFFFRIQILVAVAAHFKGAFFMVQFVFPKLSILSANEKRVPVFYILLLREIPVIETDQ